MVDYSLDVQDQVNSPCVANSQSLEDHRFWSNEGTLTIIIKEEVVLIRGDNWSRKTYRNNRETFVWSRKYYYRSLMHKS
jgi:hypothetical protein